MMHREVKGGLEEWACSREKDKGILRLLTESSSFIGRLERRVILCNYHQMMREWWDKCEGKGENRCRQLLSELREIWEFPWYLTPFSVCLEVLGVFLLLQRTI